MPFRITTGLGSGRASGWRVITPIMHSRTAWTSEVGRMWNLTSMRARSGEVKLVIGCEKSFMLGIFTTLPSVSWRVVRARPSSMTLPLILQARRCAGGS